jgi:hypothetical protein
VSADKPTVSVQSSAVQTSGNVAQIRRDMLYIGTWHPALTASTCEALQSATAVDPTSTRFQIDRDSLQEVSLRSGGEAVTRERPLLGFRSLPCELDRLVPLRRSPPASPR